MQDVCNQVDPLYLTTPLYKLVQEFGYEWVREQDKLFKQLMEKEKCQ